MADSKPVWSDGVENSFHSLFFIFFSLEFLSLFHHCFNFAHFLVCFREERENVLDLLSKNIGNIRSKAQGRIVLSTFEQADCFASTPSLFRVAQQIKAGQDFLASRRGLEKMTVL